MRGTLPRAPSQGLWEGEEFQRAGLCWEPEMPRQACGFQFLFLPEKKCLVKLPRRTFWLTRKHFAFEQRKCQEPKQEGRARRKGERHPRPGGGAPGPSVFAGGSAESGLSQRCTPGSWAGEASGRWALCLRGKWRQDYLVYLLISRLSHTRLGSNPPVGSMSSRACRGGRGLFQDTPFQREVQMSL